MSVLKTAVEISLSAVAPFKRIAEMNAQHLKLSRAIQGKALDALPGGTFGDTAQASKALAIAVREERRIRGPPSHRRGTTLRILG